jgi:hypothetical protein
MTLYTKAVKPKTCKVCRAAFAPALPMARVCSPVCAIEAVKLKNEKTAKAAQVADRRETKAKLAAMVKKSVLVARAQKAFNAYICARDAGKPCISCGKPLQAATIGGAFDCGHYRSVGSAVHMRFVEDNAHGQCKHCNRHLAGNHVAYRAGLIERIGFAGVEQIEADNTLRKYTHEGLIEIARHYNSEAKRLIGAV